MVLSAANAKARSAERSQLRSEARSSGQSRPVFKAVYDPPPDICNRLSVGWGTKVEPKDCECEKLSQWTGLHGDDPSVVQILETANDREGSPFTLADKISYFRPGGHHIKERHSTTPCRSSLCWFDSTASGRRCSQ